MTDYTDLMRRLARGLQWADDGWPVPGTSEDMQAAADAIAALQAEVARLRELPQPTVALSERPLFSHVTTPVVAHDDGSQTILDQSGNGRHWHISAKE